SSRAPSRSRAAAGAARASASATSTIIGPPPGCRSVGMRSIIQTFMARVPSEGPEQLFHFTPAAGAEVLRMRRGAEPGEKLLITGIAGGPGRLIAKRHGDYFKVAGVDRSPREGFPPNVSMHGVDLR